MQYVITDLEINSELKRVEFLLDNNREAVEIHILDDEKLSVGDVYTGKVEKCLKNANGAFVNIGDETVYLQLSKTDSVFYSHKFSKDNLLHQNDEVVVEIKNAGIKTKNPLATSRFSLETKSLLLIYGDKGIKVSKKLPADMKDEILSAFSEKANEIDDSILDDTLIMVRSNANQSSVEELVLEFESLLDNYVALTKKLVHLNPFTLVKKAKKHYLDNLIHTDSKVEKVVTDIKEVYEELISNRELLPDFEIEFYESDFELYKLYSLNQKMERALKKYVDLKSGANITIESTEAMNVIDVNSANSSKVKSQSKDDYFFKVNKEAAVEIARQIRLRNLSGIIVVDFINMKDEKLLDEIMSVLEREFRKDPLKVNVIDKTALGLVEITREKKFASLKQQLTSQ